MAIPTLKELKALKAKLQESKASYSGARLTPEGGKDFSRTKTGKQEPTPVKRDEGVAAAPKEGQVEHGKGGEPEGNGVKPVKRAEGVKDAVKEYKAENTAQGADVKPVDRAEGVGAAPKEWLKPSEFRNNLRSQLGLPLGDKLNKGNDGLNKSAKGGSVEPNKAGTPAKPAELKK
jgi:hypothetical protein